MIKQKEKQLENLRLYKASGFWENKRFTASIGFSKECTLLTCTFGKPRLSLGQHSSEPGLELVYGVLPKQATDDGFR